MRASVKFLRIGALVASPQILILVELNQHQLICDDGASHLMKNISISTRIRLLPDLRQILTLSTSLRVKLKNFIPLRATMSLVISSANRMASGHQDSFGTQRKYRSGRRDSSCTLAAYKETAKVRPIRKKSEK